MTRSYISFFLGAEKFAIPVDYVQEIVEVLNITKIPQAPEYMLGIINLRGNVLPLLDMRLKLGLPSSEITKKSRIMVLLLHQEDKSISLGAMVDLAKEVLEFSPQEIKPAPEMESKTSAPITGIINHQGDITMLMDIDRVFSQQEVNTIHKNLN